MKYDKAFGTVYTMSGPEHTATPYAVLHDLICPSAHFCTYLFSLSSYYRRRSTILIAA